MALSLGTGFTHMSGLGDLNWPSGSAVQMGNTNRQVVELSDGTLIAISEPDATRDSWDFYYSTDDGDNWSACVSNTFTTISTSDDFYAHHIAVDPVNDYIWVVSSYDDSSQADTDYNLTLYEWNGTNDFTSLYNAGIGDDVNVDYIMGWVVPWETGGWTGGAAGDSMLVAAIQDGGLEYFRQFVWDDSLTTMTTKGSAALAVAFDGATSGFLWSPVADSPEHVHNDPYSTTLAGMYYNRSSTDLEFSNLTWNSGSGDYDEDTSLTSASLGLASGQAKTSGGAIIDDVVYWVTNQGGANGPDTLEVFSSSDQGTTWNTTLSTATLDINSGADGDGVFDLGVTWSPDLSHLVVGIWVADLSASALGYRYELWSYKIADDAWNRETFSSRVASGITASALGAVVGRSQTSVFFVSTSAGGDDLYRCDFDISTLVGVSTITDPALTLTNTFYVDTLNQLQYITDTALTDADTFYIDVLEQLLVISDLALTSWNLMFVDVLDATRYVTDPSLVDADTLNVDAMGRETNFNPYWRWRFVRQDGGLYCIPAKSAQAWAGAEVVSSDFRFGWDAMEYINLAAAAAWASDSGSPAATLKAAIDTALGSFGIKDMEGNVLT